MTHALPPSTPPAARGRSFWPFSDRRGRLTAGERAERWVLDQRSLCLPLHVEVCPARRGGNRLAVAAGRRRDAATRRGSSATTHLRAGAVIQG
ncbi:unnamed protein product [Lampetra fluviatilis]